MIIIDIIRNAISSKLFDKIFDYIKENPLMEAYYREDEKFGLFQIETETKLDLFLRINEIKSSCSGWSTTEIDGKEFLCFGFNLIESDENGYDYEAELEIDFCNDFVYINYKHEPYIIPYSEINEDITFLTLKYGRFLMLDSSGEI